MIFSLFSIALGEESPSNERVNLSACSPVSGSCSNIRKPAAAISRLVKSSFGSSKFPVMRSVVHSKPRSPGAKTSVSAPGMVASVPGASPSRKTPSISRPRRVMPPSIRMSPSLASTRSVRTNSPFFHRHPVRASLSVSTRKRRVSAYAASASSIGKAVSTPF